MVSMNLGFINNKLQPQYIGEEILPFNYMMWR